MADIPTTRQTVIHSSINRPTLWLGGDRELVILTAGLSFLLMVSLRAWWGVGLSLLLWFSAVAVLRLMGKADPLLRHIYLRHMRYRDYYPAQSGLYSSGRSSERNWR